MIYSCEYHVNEALEETLTDEGLPPELELIPHGMSVSEKCFLCHHKAVYKVTEEHKQSNGT